MNDSTPPRTKQTSSSPLNEIVDIIFPPHQDNQDYLKSLIDTHFQGNREQTQAFLSQTQEQIHWSKFLEKCHTKALQVFQNLQHGLSPPQTTEVYLLTLREAMARYLQTILETKPSNEFASPFTSGARFNQLLLPTLALFMQQGISMQSFAIHPDFLKLSVLDAERAKQSMELHVGRHKYKFPALVSIAELMSSLPNEMNLKLNLTQFHDMSNLWLVRMGEGMIPSHRPLAGLCFSRHANAEVTMNALKLVPNTLLLLNQPTHLSTRSGGEMWMLCIAI